MEVIVSMLILGILMTTLFSIVRFSLALTGSSIAKAEETQNLLNKLSLDDYPDHETRKFYLESSDGVIKAMHDVEYFPDENLVAFRPA